MGTEVMAIVEFVLSALSSVVGNWLDSGIRTVIRRGFPTSRWVYLRDLHDQIKRMPFIYRDLELQVLQDSVEVELSRLDVSSLLDTDSVSYAERDTFERLRDSRKVLLVGQAGIGKTTLFRYCILSLIAKGGGRFKLPKKDHSIPCYVPLKAISASSTNPIASYLLHNNPLFQGASGVRRLISLARDRRIMLFLDGYDEISIVAGTEGIREEIATLMGRHPTGTA
jgi:predicted NACHT family NTPase